MINLGSMTQAAAPIQGGGKELAQPNLASAKVAEQMPAANGQAAPATEKGIPDFSKLLTDAQTAPSLDQKKATPQAVQKPWLCLWRKRALNSQ